ncbi:ABC transporter ATP-binding protein [Candidatus Peregrinibacteria bacterium]|nr:ABC transporter ATP-binding protein [Candidatus Peregrinibacteria bacterium]
MIKLEKVSKKFPRAIGLDKATLEIKEGEFVALIGPSGSGKSTLLNMIGGLEYPSSGTVTVGNKKLNNKTDQELSTYRNTTIGFVFQEFHLQAFLTVKDNVLLPTFFNHHSDNEYADELIKEVGLSHKSNVKVADLSGGEKQRTAIARALINKPQIILADEPTGNLDIETGKTILELLKKLHKNHKTTLIIATHDLSVAKAAKRTIKIKDGKLIK